MDGGVAVLLASAGVDVGVGVGVMPLLRKPLVCGMLGEGDCGCGCDCEVGMVRMRSGSATDVDTSVASVRVCRSAIVEVIWCQQEESPRLGVRRIVDAQELKLSRAERSEIQVRSANEGIESWSVNNKFRFRRVDLVVQREKKVIEFVR